MTFSSFDFFSGIIFFCHGYKALKGRFIYALIGNATR